MTLFLFGLVLLYVGYHTYGKYVEAILAPDDRLTPARRMADGVDYVVLPHWRNMLIQLLNIAGIGPVIGVILGVKFGPIVFLMIPLGNIFGGAVHDFVAAMMSMRADGANLPALIHKQLGPFVYRFFLLFMAILLVLVVAVFINVPASLLNNLMPSGDYFWPIVGAIFAYYIAATLLPIDKIIGRFYPIFGMMLLLGTAFIFFALLLFHNADPASFMVETDEFREVVKQQPPIIPCLFVTIACGLLSGFHATQSPIVVRTMSTERNARATFYGMMIVEGVIAMVWAAAAMAIYNLSPETMKLSGAVVLNKITERFLGGGLGMVTVLAVVVLAITSGDTALRSLRLSMAEAFRIPQKPILNRILICLPLIAVVSGILWWSNLSAESFAKTWNYFAWGNQVLAATTLLAASAWLISLKKNFWVTLVPGLFMSFVVLTYILWISPKKGGPVGFGLPLTTSYGIAAGLSVLFGLLAILKGRKNVQKTEETKEIEK